MPTPFGNRAKRQLREIARRVLISPRDGRPELPPLDASQRLDRERVTNTGSTEIPPYGAMQITGWQEGNGGVYEVARPSAAGNSAGILINGREAIAVDGSGWGHWATIRPVVARVDVTSLALGDSLGPVADSDDMSPEGSGYRLASLSVGDNPPRALVRLDTGLLDVFWKGATSSGSSGSVGLYKRFVSDPLTDVEIKLARRGYCPPSSGSSGSSGCDRTGYDPNSEITDNILYTQLPIGYLGYDYALWAYGQVLPPAPPPTGSWTMTTYQEYDPTMYWGEGPAGCTVEQVLWRNYQCNWAAWGYRHCIGP